MERMEDDELKKTSQIQLNFPRIIENMDDLEKYAPSVREGGAQDSEPPEAPTADANQEQEFKEIEQLGESIWLTDKFVDYPKTIIFLGLCLILMFAFLTVFFELYLPSPITNRDLLDYEDINTKLFDAREAAVAEI